MLREERMNRRYTKDMETRESDIQKLSPSYSSDECCSWNISGFPRCDHTKNVTFWSCILDSKSETKGRHFTSRLKHLFNYQHSNLSSIFLPAREQQCPSCRLPQSQSWDTKTIGASCTPATVSEWARVRKKPLLFYITDVSEMVITTTYYNCSK